MNDKPKIIVGLVIALVVLTFPFWRPLLAGRPGPPPELELPEGKKCVKDGSWMRANHMNLLKEWRQTVVREADKSPIEINGHEYEKSLTKGCMKCHTSRVTFCSWCHEYANVLPLPPLRASATTPRAVRCWNCHVEPQVEETE